MNKVEIEQEIEQLEKGINDALERLVVLKKQRTNHEQVIDHTLQTWDGSTVKLSELFGAHDDLIVIHNMGISCSYCTLWADGFNGYTKPFNDRAAFVLVSPDPIEVQKEVAATRGWNFRMLSSHGHEFTADMGFSEVKEGRTFYQPGYSTFRRQADGSIQRVAYDYFGPGDVYCSPWHMFELLENGVDNWHPKKTYPGQ